MVNGVKGVQPTGRAVYAAQAERAAWREEVLTRMLQKIRQVQPVLEADGPGRGAMGGPEKGRHLDVYI
ncbi:MAG: hypothetical protein KKB20_27290 [Proteobacteria bacterium]|nr:hypothetical protein [Pseudomonadota bacterium]